MHTTIKFLLNFLFLIKTIQSEHVSSLVKRQSSANPCPASTLLGLEVAAYRNSKPKACPPQQASFVDDPRFYSSELIYSFMCNNANLFSALFVTENCLLSTLDKFIPICECDCKSGHGASKFQLCYQDPTNSEIIGCRCVYTEEDNFPYNEQPRNLSQNSAAITSLSTSSRITSDTGGVVVSQRATPKANDNGTSRDLLNETCQQVFENAIILICAIDGVYTLVDGDGCEVALTALDLCRIDCHYNHHATVSPYGFCALSINGQAVCYCIY